MPWFRNRTEPPRLISLHSIGVDDEDIDSLPRHSKSRDISPVRCTRLKSSDSESESNCYNVQTNQVTTTKSSKKNQKSIQDERRRCMAKKGITRKNSLLDRFKNTRLSFLKIRSFDLDDVQENNKARFISMDNLENEGLMSNDRRGREKKIPEEEKIQVKSKRRSKSYTRFTSKKSLEEFSFVGFKPLSIKNCWSRENIADRKSPTNSPERTSVLRDNSNRPKSLEFLSICDRDNALQKELHLYGDASTVAKYRAVDRQSKYSTSRLIAKIYNKDKEICRPRSFSYGALPGLDELRTNPLFQDQDQDDNDSGILDNGSATSSLIDDRCGSGASSFITSATNDSPPLLRPKNKSSNDVEPNVQRCLSVVSLALDTPRVNKKLTEEFTTNHMKTPRPNINISRNSLNSVHQAANRELIDKRVKLNRNDSQRQSYILDNRLHVMDEGVKELPVIKSKTYKKKTIVVTLTREKPDQLLGIFITKNPELCPGYLVGYVVPNGLADKEGTMRIGDEILIVNGKRLRGLDMAAAKNVVGCGNMVGNVDIVISRPMDEEKIRAISKFRSNNRDYENVLVENSRGILISDKNSPKSHFKKKYKSQKDKKRVSTLKGSDDLSNFCTIPRRKRLITATFITVVFEKGPGRKPLGFTIVGGKDSPKGSIGHFIKTVLPNGQAAENRRLLPGDEMMSVNGQLLSELTNHEAIQLFRNVKNGSVVVNICRRIKGQSLRLTKTKSCSDLLDTEDLDSDEK